MADATGNLTGRAAGNASARTFQRGNVEVVVNDQALTDLLSSSDGAVAKALLRLGLRVEREAKALCPVDTGRLRASIATRLERDGDSYAAVVGTNVDYAPFVELGTVHQHAQPFLVPALMSITGETARAETRNVGSAA